MKSARFRSFLDRFSRLQDKKSLVSVLPEFTKQQPARYSPITSEEYLRQCLEAAMGGALTTEAKKSLLI